MAGVRLTPQFRAEIKAWADRQPDSPPLSEAIRRLIKSGLGKSK